MGGGELWKSVLLGYLLVSKSTGVGPPNHRVILRVSAKRGKQLQEKRKVIRFRVGEIFAEVKIPNQLVPIEIGGIGNKTFRGDKGGKEKEIDMQGGGAAPDI